MENISEVQSPILIYENENRFKSMLEHGHRLCLLVGEVKANYLKTNLGPFDDQVYKSLISGGLASIQEKLIADVTQRYETLNLRSETMKQEILSDAHSIIEAIRNSVVKLKQQSNRNGEMGDPAFPLDLLSINAEQEPEITAEAMKEVKERYCSTYLNTPEEAALYKKFQEVADACTALKEELKLHNFQMPFTFPSPPIFSVLQKALHEKDGHITVNAPYVIWATKQQYQEKI